MKELVMQYIPHADISGLSESERIDKLLKTVKDNRIVILEGRLKKTEEAALIRKTMESIDKKFKGIELAVVFPSKQSSFMDIIRRHIANVLLGTRDGMTIIGPATVVREIKQNPDKIELFTVDSK